MCRPMPFNKKLIAEGKVINVGKNLVISEGYLRDEEGKLYAHATATNMIIRR
jgi:acyl-coenzyme A thioesterase PaaI-like protein